MDLFDPTDACTAASTSAWRGTSPSPGAAIAIAGRNHAMIDAPSLARKTGGHRTSPRRPVSG